MNLKFILSLVIISGISTIHPSSKEKKIIDGELLKEVEQTEMTLKTNNISLDSQEAKLVIAIVKKDLQ